jgi:hypothetical protein
MTESGTGSTARRGASRREFLAGAGLTGVALASGAWQPLAAEAAAGGTLPLAAVDARGYIGGFTILSDTDPHLAGSKLGLTLKGTPAGTPSGVGGGRAISDVVVEKLGADGITHKHLAGIKYEDFELQVSPGMSKGFYQWIQSTIGGKVQSMDGSLVGITATGGVGGSVDFTNALITEVGLPALDASSKEAAKMRLKFAPEFTRGSKGGSAQGSAIKSTLQKGWSASSFRLTIAGLDATKVNKIEAITIKQKLVDNALGEKRDFQAQLAGLDVPNLVVTFSEASSQSWVQWHEDFVIKGNNSQDYEKAGKLEFLSSDLKEALFTLTFSNLGIFRLGAAATTAGSEAIRRLTAEMYCESISFEYGPSTYA